MTEVLALKLLQQGFPERLVPLYYTLDKAYAEYSGEDIATIIGYIRADITMKTDINK